MRWKRALVLFTLIATLAALLCAPLTSHAQSYSFSLDQLEVNVWINNDGSASLEYWLVFTCDPGAHPIEIVDLSLPNSDFSRSDIDGNTDGTPIDHVGSDFEGEGKDGVALYLGNGTIDPGQTGTVEVKVKRVGSMVYEDDNDAEYASVKFAPLYFVGTVHGTTDMIVRFFLPEGVQPDEGRWHASPSGWPGEPNTGLEGEKDRVMYEWYNPAADPSRQHFFGASFPRKYVSAGTVQTAPPKPSPVETSINSVFSFCGSACVPCGFLGFFGGIIALSVWGNRRRKMKYLPPSMKVEGVGIKRGLTAVEAAILLETPLNRIMTMLLFGLLKKGAVTVLEDKPLKTKVNEPRPAKLQTYEDGFLDAVKQDGTLSETKLRKMMVALVKEVGNKIKGFSRKETVTYYKDIVRRAWQQVEGADTPEVRSQRFDEGLEWTMMDDEFDNRVNRTFSTGPVFMPVWWGYYRPWARRVQPAPVGTAKSPSPSRTTSGRGDVRLPTLPGAAFAASIVTGVQSTASNIVRSVTGFTGDVTQVTNPPPKPSGRSYGGGRGGSSCACACACACAGCACACAGGGR